MSDDDVIRLEDLWEWLGPSGDATVLARGTVAVAVAVLAVGLTLGVLVHTPGAVNEDAVDEGDQLPSDFENPKVVQKNWMVSWFHRAAGPLLAATAAGVGFVAAPAWRGRGMSPLALGGGAGGALGYVAFVAVGHAAFAPTKIGVYVETPPQVRFGALAANAVGVAVAATVAAAIGTVAGARLQRGGHRARVRGRANASEASSGSPSDDG